MSPVSGVFQQIKTLPQIFQFWCEGLFVSGLPCLKGYQVRATRGVDKISPEYSTGGNSQKIAASRSKDFANFIDNERVEYL